MDCRLRLSRLSLSSAAWNLWAAGFVVACLSACGNGEPSASCHEPLPRASLGECAPLYEPVFARVYENTISASCAVGSGCHGAASPVESLTLAGGQSSAHQALLQAGAVVPGDPECSPLVDRLESSSADFRMPRGGAPLTEEERCAIVQWIASGAAPP